MPKLLTPLALVFVVVIGVFAVVLVLALQGHTRECLEVLSYLAVVALGLLSGAALDKYVKRGE